MDSPLDKEVLPKVYSVKHKSYYDKNPFCIQIINLKHYDVGKSRLMMFDGKYTCQGVMDKELYEKLQPQGFQKSSVIRVLKHSCFDEDKFYSSIYDAEVVLPTYSTESGPTTKVTEYFNQHPEENYFKNKLVDPVAAPVKKSEPSDTFQGQKITSIELLSPYQNSWVIKARVSYKGDLRTWQNAKGTGHLFNINLLDDSDEIRATAFNEVAIKLHSTIQDGKVYFISKARLQQAKRQFSKLSHPYELALERDTIIEECFDNTDDVPQLKFNFVKLNKIQSAEPNAIVDVIGVLREVREPFHITSKATGKPFERRDIEIVDDSNFAITVGLWNQTAVDFSLGEGTVIAFKGCKVSDFGGRSLTLTQTGSIMASPDAPEAYQLKGWYDNQGAKESFQTLKSESGNSNSYLNNRKTILQAQDENLGLKEEPEFFSTKATINFLKKDTYSYPACVNKPDGRDNTCNRKIIDQGDGTWRCEKCDINYNEPSYRYILSASIMDSTGQIWTTFFDQDASKLLGLSANELKKLEAEGDPKFDEIMENSIMKEYGFRIKARQDSYNGNTRIRYQTQGLYDLDFSVECEQLIKELDAVL